VSEPAALALAQLEDELTELAAEINAGTCRRRWGQPGLRSCADWLSWRCAVSASAAREQLRVAHALAALPLIRAAFSRGEPPTARCGR
jgi:hypothetical protein